MFKNIMRDPLFLSQKSEAATKEDLQIGRDLMDTLRANRERCVVGTHWGLTVRPAKGI